MFAVIRTGGKQLKVAKDDVVAVEKLDAKPGDKIDLGEVLMLGGDGEPQIGTPLVDGAKVKAEVVEQTRAAKIIVFKKKRRQNYRRKHGHRQDQTVLKILDVAGKGAKKEAPKKEAAPKAQSAEKKTAEKKPAAKKPAAKKPAAKKAPAKKDSGD